MDRISIEELQRKLEKRGDAVVLLDARGDRAYEKEHIPHAKSAPETALRERVDGLVERDAEIILYCTDEECAASRNAGRRLEEMGFTNVLRVPAGIEGWKKAGNDTVTA